MHKKNIHHYNGLKDFRNTSGIYFIKSELSLLINEKCPRGKLQFSSKNFQTINIYPV